MFNARRRTILTAIAGIPTLVASGPSFAPASRIVVLGLGSAGGHAIDCMSFHRLGGLSYATFDVDPGGRDRHPGAVKIPLALEAANQPTRRVAVAPESSQRIAAVVSGARRVIIIAHMGGRSGSRLAPAIARIARAEVNETYAVVAMPFEFEGLKRRQRAWQAIAEVTPFVDRLAVIWANDHVPKAATDVSMAAVYERLAIALRDEALAAVS